MLHNAEGIGQNKEMLRKVNKPLSGGAGSPLRLCGCKKTFRISCCWGEVQTPL